MSGAEYHVALKGQSWKLRLMNTIDECMKYAADKDAFISLSRLFWHLARIKPSLSRVRLLRPHPGTDSPVELRITEGGTSDAD